MKNADGYKLDKQHTFRVNLFTDFDKWVSFKIEHKVETQKNLLNQPIITTCSSLRRYMNISDEWETPEKQPFKDFVSFSLVSLINAVTLWLNLKRSCLRLCNPVTFVLLFVQGNMRHWIEDQDCRDQYSVIYEAGERTAIFSNDSKEPIVSEERAVSMKYKKYI